MQPQIFHQSRFWTVVKGIFLCYTVKNSGIFLICGFWSFFSVSPWKIHLKSHIFIEIFNGSSML